ncbi:hypothetical protein M378DRAFT_17435 [Amanita muscaria Koide BX008]|uniref:Uncharacterized protein n=1 Tax=Amanita muscaria (strain Koide BX008) TaxID=946122 RepID=A0A0C2WIV2_AMAMK|nr:hypothetical protein M378DRAFT_17435 [Amanita muscaria Koide BX008]
MSLHVPHQYRPRIAWLEDGQVKALTPDQVGFVKDLKDIDVGVSDYGYLVGWKKGAPTHIQKMVEDGMSIKAWGRMISSDEVHQIAFGGRYVARVYWFKKFQKAVVDLFLTVQIETQRHYFPFDPSSYDSIHHVSSLTIAPNPRVVISTSTGTVQSRLLSTTDAELLWNREEALSGISAAELVQLPEQQSTVALVRECEGFIGSLQRQLVQAQDLPHYLYHFFLRYTARSSSVSRPVTPVNSSELSRDPFGFRQLIIAVSLLRTLERFMPSTQSTARLCGAGSLDLDGLRRRGPTAAEEVTRPEVVLVTQRFAANTLVNTVIFHIDPLTGYDATISYKGHWGSGIFPAERDKGDCFSSYRSTFTLKMKKRRLRDKETGTSTKRVVGNGVELNDALNDRYAGYQTWTLSLPPNEKLQTQQDDVVQVFERKMSGVLTESTTRTCGLYVVDATKGTVIYRASLPAFTGFEGSKKVRMTSVEMYEGLAEQKTESLGMLMSSYNPDMRDVTDRTGLRHSATTSTNLNSKPAQDVAVPTLRTAATDSTFGSGASNRTGNLFGPDNAVDNYSQNRSDSDGNNSNAQAANGHQRTLAGNVNKQTMSRRTTSSSATT